MGAVFNEVFSTKWPDCVGEYGAEYNEVFSYIAAPVLIMALHLLTEPHQLLTNSSPN